MVLHMTPAAVQRFNREATAREPSRDVLCWPTRFLITKMDGQHAPELRSRTAASPEGQHLMGRTQAEAVVLGSTRAVNRPTTNPSKVSPASPPAGAATSVAEVLLICHPGKG